MRRRATGAWCRTRWRSGSAPGGPRGWAGPPDGASDHGRRSARRGRRSAARAAPTGCRPGKAPARTPPRLSPRLGRPAPGPRRARRGAARRRVPGERGDAWWTVLRGSRDPAARGGAGQPQRPCNGEGSRGRTPDPMGPANSTRRSPLPTGAPRRLDARADGCARRPPVRRRRRSGGRVNCSTRRRAGRRCALASPCRRQLDRELAGDLGLPVHDGRPGRLDRQPGVRRLHQKALAKTTRQAMRGLRRKSVRSPSLVSSAMARPTAIISATAASIFCSGRCLAG